MTAPEETRPEQDARWQLARQLAREMDSARMTLIVAGLRQRLQPPLAHERQQDFQVGLEECLEAGRGARQDLV